MTRDVSFTITVVAERDGQEWHAYCPALRGLHTCGDTEKEAVRNAAHAAVAYLQSIIKHGDPIPLGVAVERTTIPHRICRRIFRPRPITEDVTIQVPAFVAP